MTPGAPRRDEPDHSRPIMTEYSRPFECKGKDELPKFDGRTAGQMWRQKTVKFLITRAPEMGRALAWAEEQTERITAAQVLAAPWRRAVCPKVLGHHLWGFLNTALVGDAYTMYANVEESNGFEAWRRTVRNITRRSPAELMRLEGKVLSPQQCSKGGEILMALEHWEAAFKAYSDAGGEPISSKRLANGVMRVLPDAVRDKVIWDFGADKSAEEIMEWLRLRLRSTSTWLPDGRTHLLQDDADDDEPDIEDYLDEEALEELHALGYGCDADGRDELNAVVRKIFQRRGRAPLRQPPGRRPGGPGGRGPRAPGASGDDRRRPPGARIPGGGQRERGPPRAREDLRCPNCLETGHSGFECKKPKVNERLCFQCRKPGHQARNCPDKPAQHAKAVEATQSHSFCLEGDGFVPVQRRRRADGAGPRPRGATLGDFMPTATHNRYKNLEHDGADEDNELSTIASEGPVGDC